MAIHENHQWAVTDLGIESVDPFPTYQITRDRLTESTDYGEGEIYDWPTHLAEKSWVDLEAFIDAYRTALFHHSGRYKPPVDPALLEKSIDAGRNAAR